MKVNPMRHKRILPVLILTMAGCLAAASYAAAQVPPPPAKPPAPRQKPARPAPNPKAEALRGAYGPFRANNDLLSYDLDVRVDPAAKSWTGKNTIRFKMLKEDSRIQLDMKAHLKVEKITSDGLDLPYSRE